MTLSDTSALSHKLLAVVSEDELLLQSLISKVRF